MLTTSRPSWSFSLLRPLVFPDATTLKTLADARKLIKDLPEAHRVRST